MAIQTITMQVTGAIVCGVGGPNMQAGDSVRLLLDKTDYPTLPDYINGVIQQPVTAVNVIDPGTGDPVCGTQYIINYDDVQLLGIVPSLDPCDVTDLECVTCCDVLNDRLDTTVDPLIAANTAAAAAAQATADQAITGVTLAQAAAAQAQAAADQAITDAAAAQATADQGVGDSATAQAAADAAQATADQAIADAATAQAAADAAQAAADAAQAAADEANTSVVTSNIDVHGVVTLTHDDGDGNTADWFSVPANRLVLTDGLIVNDFLEVSVPDGAGGRLTKYIPIQDTSV